MKKRMLLLTMAFSIAGSMVIQADAFDHYYDYENPDGTYSYYFYDEDLFVTIDREWYRNTRVVIEDSGASFYHKASYEAYEAEGMTGGLLFTIGESANTDYESYPQFEYIACDEETEMNYYAVLPTDYQAYMEDEAVRTEYDALWAGVEDVIAGIRLGTVSHPSGPEETETTGNGSGSDTMLAGGWEVMTDSSVSAEARAVFDQAMQDHDRIVYDPVALLATQVVAGKNYCFLYRTTVTESNDQPVYGFVYLYEDLEGKVHVLEKQDIQFGLSETE